MWLQHGAASCVISILLIFAPAFKNTATIRMRACHTLFSCKHFKQGELATSLHDLLKVTPTILLCAGVRSFAVVYVLKWVSKNTEPFVYNCSFDTNNASNAVFAPPQETLVGCFWTEI